jgi:hypothetical protein
VNRKSNVWSFRVGDFGDAGDDVEGMKKGFLMMNEGQKSRGGIS